MVDDGKGRDGRALQETTVFLSHFKDLPDYRQKGKVAYPLEEVLLLLLLRRWRSGDGGRHCALRPGQAGVPSTFSTFRQRHPLARPVEQHPGQSRPGGVPALFVAWAAALTKTSAEVIAIDGKTVRRSYQKKGPKSRSMSSRPSPRANAWCSDRPSQRQVERDRRHSGAARAVAIEGAVVTIDAAVASAKSPRQSSTRRPITSWR